VCRDFIDTPENTCGSPTPRLVCARTVSAIKPYEGFGDVDHTIKELMSL
jgi:hypothetical protein